jgi:hypothetical protein
VRHEDRIVDLEFYGQLDLVAVAGIKTDRLDLVLQLAQDGSRFFIVEASAFEVGRQRHHQHVDLLVRRADRLRVGTVERDGLGIERVPHGRIGIGRLEPVVVEARDALDVGQRRHVHDRHAWHARLGDRIEQLAHAGRAVLRLLHAQSDQIIVLGVDARGRAGGDGAGKFPRIQHHRVRAAAHRQAHAKALGVDQVGFRRQADQMQPMAAEQEL